MRLRTASVKEEEWPNSRLWNYEKDGRAILTDATGDVLPKNRIVAIDILTGEALVPVLDAEGRPQWNAAHDGGVLRGAKYAAPLRLSIGEGE